MYYIREGYYSSGLKTIQGGCKTHTNDTVLRYYSSIACILQDKNHEAVKDLELLKNREDVGLGAMLALVFTHRKFSNIGLLNLIKNPNL